MSETILETIRRDGFSFEALAAGYPELLLLKQVPKNNLHQIRGWNPGIAKAYNFRLKTIPQDRLPGGGTLFIKLL